MAKPVKKYDVKYPKSNKRSLHSSDSKNIYMCEYIDIFAKKPLEEDQDTKLREM